MDAGHEKKEETIKASLLILGYLIGLVLIVRLTVHSPALGQYAAAGVLALGIVFVLAYMAKTWIEVEKAEDGD